MADMNQGQNQQDESLYGRFIQFCNSGVAKGIVLVAVAMIAAMALAGGAMGAGWVATHLLVNGAQMTTFAAGASAGITNAMGFLTSGFGLATMAAGAIAGAIFDATHNQNAVAQDNARIAGAPEQALGMQQQPDLQPAIGQDAQKESAPETNSLKDSIDALKEKFAATSDRNNADNTADNGQNTGDKQNTQQGAPNDEMYDQGYLAGIRKAREANASANEAYAAYNQGRVGEDGQINEAPTVNVQNVIARHEHYHDDGDHFAGDQVNTTEVNGPVDSVNQVAIANAQAGDPSQDAQATAKPTINIVRGPDGRVIPRPPLASANAGAFASAEVQRRADRDAAGNVLTV